MIMMMAHTHMIHVDDDAVMKFFETWKHASYIVINVRRRELKSPIRVKDKVALPSNTRDMIVGDTPPNEILSLLYCLKIIIITPL